jgi:hypothetical protein
MIWGCARGGHILVKTVLGRIVEDLHVVIEPTEVGSAEMVVTMRVEPTIGELLPGRLRSDVSNVRMTSHVQDHGTLLPQGTLRPRGGGRPETGTTTTGSGRRRG